MLVSLLKSDPKMRLEGDTVYIRMPQASDWAQWAHLRESSRDFLVPWEPVWPADDLTKAAFGRRLRRYTQSVRQGNLYPFFVFTKRDDRLVGGITLTNVRRGTVQGCSVGYWVGESHARSGYMSDALQTSLTFAFDALGLHRVEAACLPENQPSRRLLIKSGFTEEGHAREYLKICGAWRDHVRFGILATDPRPGRR
jgi:[ribosomal protein S5]-alanine N-acetyltransferase